jgi:hypothetical protein
MAGRRVPVAVIADRMSASAGCGREVHPARRASFRQSRRYVTVPRAGPLQLSLQPWLSPLQANCALPVGVATALATGRLPAPPCSRWLPARVDLAVARRAGASARRRAAPPAAYSPRSKRAGRSTARAASVGYPVRRRILAARRCVGGAAPNVARASQSIWPQVGSYRSIDKGEHDTRDDACCAQTTNC